MVLVASRRLTCCRYIHACWDLNEVVAKKAEIVCDDLLVTKLAGPAKSM